MTLVGFLLARIDEDEAAAKAALAEGVYPHFGDTAAEEVLQMAESEGCARIGIAHFERHRPNRVLADCESNRQILAEHSNRPMYPGDADRSDDPYCLAHDGGPLVENCPTLLSLALRWADHEDYREEWRS